MSIAGAYQGSQGSYSENDPNNTTVSIKPYAKRDLEASITLSFIILQ